MKKFIVAIALSFMISAQAQSNLAPKLLAECYGPSAPLDGHPRIIDLQIWKPHEGKVVVKDKDYYGDLPAFESSFDADAIRVEYQIPGVDLNGPQPMDVSVSLTIELPARQTDGLKAATRKIFTYPFHSISNQKDLLCSVF